MYKDITFDIRGACFWVWKEFGGAFKEKVVDRALTIELKRRGRKVEDQKRLDITYQGIKVGTYVPDKIVDGLVLVELKCKEFLTQGDIDQFWKYLKGSNYKVGLLINFGPKKLEIKRIVYDTARRAKDPRSDQRSISALISAEKAFTLIEIMVAAIIFAIFISSTLALFNYVLKINRRSEALRQASQGMRNFTEFLVKEIRNGQIDYYVTNGQTYSNYINGDSGSPCGPQRTPGDSVGVGDRPTYKAQENKLGIITTDNLQECFYYTDQSGSNYVGDSIFTAPAGQNFKLAIIKTGVTNPATGRNQPQILTPENMRVDNLMFLIRPVKDPYTPVGGYSKAQPSVTLIVKFVVSLPTGEQVPIYYQTTISSNKYDIPNR